MNTQLKLTIVVVMVGISACCNTKDSQTKYGPVESAVLTVVEAMRGEFGSGDIRATFNADSLMALLLKQGRINEHQLLSGYNVEFAACKNHYRVRVYDNWRLIMDDVNCTKGFLDGRVYAGEKPLPLNYDLCNCSGK